ncbi:UNVERIFIED_CONTAM: Retrovirus-related Pol polyprotein from transposon TNT 1-94 [Sesamum calycinum]|uniref:Retrovirus-related Pol polyprotein from transposon TNT 1-94 n=1 Tax=Sesamum calycinum TaxID=2727403 RepID=A0AAW2IXX5_9LAMI
MIKKPFVGQSPLASGLLDLIYTDVCGPLNTPARRGFLHFITFTNDHSRYGYVYLMGVMLETAAKFLNMAPSKMVTQTPYEIWHGNPTSYKFIEYPKETMGYYFYDPSEQNIFISRNAVFLKKSFSLDNRRDEVLLEESSEPPQQNNTTSLEPSFPTDGVPFLCISTRESRLPERYGFVGLTSQLDNDPKTYGEAMSDIDSDKWLEAMKSKMDSIDSNQVWTLVDPPKGIKPVMDVKMAFLNGYVEEDIFMDQSEDFTSVGEEQRDRSRKMLGLTQSSYIEKVLKRFKMENSKRGFFPMRHGIKLSKKQSPKTYEELKRMLDISYTSVVGSIQYAVQCTRLYVAYALSITSGYRHAPGRRTGCSKQATTSDSTTEAEYITTSEVVWMKNYIQELGVVPSIAEPVVIFCDNNRAITQARIEISYRSKHILRRYHLLREMVNRGDVRIDRVSSEKTQQIHLPSRYRKLLILSI